MHNILIAAGTGLAAAVAGVTFGLAGSDEPAKAPADTGRTEIYAPGDVPGDHPIGGPGVKKEYVDSRTGGRDL